MALLMAAWGLIAAMNAAAVAQAAPISVAGQVVNGTSGSGSVVGLMVALHMQGAESYDSSETTTDGEGRFRFDDITFDASLIYAVSVRYQDALYGTEVSLADGTPPPVIIEVFDAVYDQAVIRVGSASLLFADADRTTQSITALEIVKVINDSEFTFVPGTGGPMNLLRFGLPPDAEGLQVDTRLLGADIVQVDRGFAVLGSVPPGEHDIMFTYRFPYEGTEETFTKSLPFGADSLRALSPDEALRLTSEDIGAPESVSIGERPYQLIEATGIERGRRIDFQLSELPRMTIADRLQSGVSNARYEYAPLALLSLFLAALIPFALLRRRSNLRGSDKGVPHPSPPPERKGERSVS